MKAKIIREKKKKKKKKHPPAFSLWARLAKQRWAQGRKTVQYKDIPLNEQPDIRV